MNARGGLYRNALQAASLQGREKIVRLLLDEGAEGEHIAGCVHENIVLAREQT